MNIESTKGKSRIKGKNSLGEANTAEEITALKAEIEGYEGEFDDATTFEEKKLYGELITTRRQTLNALLASLAPAPTAGNYLILVIEIF